MSITSDLSVLGERIISKGLQKGLDAIQIKIRKTHASYIRFANSEIHKFSTENTLELKLVGIIGKKRGLSLILPTSEDEIEKALTRLVSITRSNREDPDQLPFFEGVTNYPKVNTLDPSFDNWDQEYMGNSVKEVINAAHGVDKRVFNVSGMLQALKHEFIFMNSEDLKLNSTQTEFWYGVDVLAKEGSNTGRNSQGEINRFGSNIPLSKLAEGAARYAILGINPVKLEPGNYPAVLDYYAVLEPLVFINLGLSGLFAMQHRSFLARKMGQKIFSDSFNLKHVPHTPEISTSKPFDDEGLPTQEFYFIQDGVLKSFAHNRFTALKMKTEPNGCAYESERTSFGIPFATKLESPSQNKSFENLIESIDNGILISRLFYSNWANPMAGILTGTTRNGFFKIEAGEITKSLYPMRHTTSVFEMFGEGLELSNEFHQAPMQMMPGVQSIMAPAVKVPKMNMTTYAN
ncbi:MAG: TldD/PmbA family protein [Candidatus Hodarchaeales archaeon]